MIDLKIATPDNQSFETKVPQQTMVLQLISALLYQWDPPDLLTSRSQSFALRRPAAEELLTPSATLEELGITDTMTLELTSSALVNTAPVSLLIEGKTGPQFATVVRLDTQIGQLADAFLHDSAGNSPIHIELQGREKRLLDPGATLFQEGIDDYATLRIYREEEQ